MVSRGDNLRKILFEHISQRPGIRFMELTRLTEMSSGGLSHHLKILEKAGTIKAVKAVRSSRYYPGSFDGNPAVIEAVRSKATRLLVTILSENGSCTFGEIVGLCKKAPSTVSSQLSWLRKKGIIQVVYGKPTLYSLSSREMEGKITAYLKSVS